MLDHQEVGRRLDDAQQRRVALRRAAQRADRVLGERVAALAVTDLLRRMLERARQRAGAGAVVLQQVQRHSLRRPRAHAGQAAQRAREIVEAA